jgi:hypothetical protein
MISAAFEYQNSASRDSFSISISQETLSNEDVVEIETGDGDLSAVLKYIIATRSSSRSHKSSCISCTFLLY